MSSAVLDASILIALLRGQPGAEEFTREVSESVVSSVNAAEAISKLIRLGASDEQAWRDVRMLADIIVPFDELQCRLASVLTRETQAFGLSLGDRACLALGVVRGVPVYTADRVWAQLQVGADVRVVR